MFDRILIANRGEIACRVMRTCRRMGIGTIAVWSDADVDARHVREADLAIRIGPAPARESYLDARRVVDAAIEGGADAIHPGYGFLSEKVELVDACRDAGLVFIGPHRDAIARMGSKIESKRIARSEGIACVPGYDGDDQSADRLADAAARIGFPLLIKASAGGGGKGMKRVDRAEAFAAQLAAARGEALASFGDDRVLLERCIERPRHLEVQLLGDRHGGLVHLFERECSIQRNYQKLIEEAPAPHLADALRERLFDAALALGRAIGYDSAGTVEFVLDADRAHHVGTEPFFLEMNTRLQVEHPVTERTALAADAPVDLVEQQIRSASGEPLAFTQRDIRRTGWAIEARINAEVPEREFGASFGAVTRYDEPVAADVRIDSGIDVRSVVTPHYDAMLAKAIASGPTRAVARDRLLAALRGLRIEGVETNQALLAAIIGHASFDAVLTTRFLADAFGAGWQADRETVDERVAAAAAAWYFAVTRRSTSDRPLDALAGFRLTATAGRRATTTVAVEEDGATRTVVVEDHGPRRVACRIDGASRAFHGDADTVSSIRHAHAATHRDGSVAIWSDGSWKRFRVTSALRVVRAIDRAVDGGDRLVADLPGVVTQLLVESGQDVTAGMPVLVVEAMKLFHTLVAPRDGRIAAMRVAVGAIVERGAVLLELATRD